MCLLAILFDSVPGCPLVVGANREEFYDRPSDPPRILRDEPRIWGGRDRRAGGTWLGVNENGVFAAVTNRRGPAVDRARSRGLLCLQLLEADSAADAAQALQKEISATSYNPFNLLLSDGREAYAAQNEPKSHISSLNPGLHMVTDGDLNDLALPRIQRAQSLLADRDLSGPDEAVAVLRDLLGDHESGVSFRDMICIHGVESGTVSSSILTIWPEHLDRSRYYHAEGKPCEANYGDYSELFLGGTK